MRKIILLTVIAFTCLAFQTGCERFAAKPDFEGEMAYSAKGMAAPPAPARMAAPMSGAMDNAVSDISPVSIEQKIIRSAEIRIKVGSVQKASKDAKEIVEGMGGMVTNTSAYEDDEGNKAMRVTLKVPSDKLDAALAKLSELGEVREEDVRSQDVTEQYVDLEARLANAKRLEKRMQDLLQKQNAKLEDIVKIEKELGRVREKIESMIARKRYFDSRISMSTIEAVFYEPQGFGRGIFEPISGLLQRSLSAFTASIAFMIVFLSAAVPWAALLFFIAWLSLKSLRLYIRHRREMKAKKKKEEKK